MTNQLRVRRLGRRPYEDVFEDMKTFTNQRTDASIDEIWLLEHDPVYTQGQAGKAEHLIMPGDIPVVQSDRGGQVTYHGPGQVVAYLLLDIRRLNIGIRDLVSGIEQAVIAYLKEEEIEAAGRREAPGVYVFGKKIASLGLRVRRGCTYHGLSLNVAMDLAPFAGINPCGMGALK